MNHQQRMSILLHCPYCRTVECHSHCIHFKIDKILNVHKPKIIEWKHLCTGCHLSFGWPQVRIQFSSEFFILNVMRSRESINRQIIMWCAQPMLPYKMWMSKSCDTIFSEFERYSQIVACIPRSDELKCEIVVMCKIK